MNLLSGKVLIEGNYPTFTLKVAGQDFLFEKHYLGPMPCKSNGLERRLPDNSPFWKAVSHWYEQGCRSENGVCLWAPPPDPMVGFDIVHLGGKHYQLKRKLL